MKLRSDGGDSFPCNTAACKIAEAKKIEKPEPVIEELWTESSEDDFFDSDLDLDLDLEEDDYDY